MKNGIPAAYAAYRTWWSLMHVGLVVLMSLIGAIWFVVNANGPRLISQWWYGAVTIQAVIANAIPFPWGR
jgi:hypothetical protein